MKHLVTIIDGTWVSAADDSEQRFSNAYNLNWLLDSRAASGATQVTFYYSGVGTEADASPGLAGLTGRGVDYLTREAYINLCSNYREDSGEPDRIYLFGFSRGAIVARALSGIIGHCGLLKSDRMYLFPQVWQAFTSGATLDGKLSGAVRRNVRVNFMGLFDCVFGSRNRSGRFHSLNFTSFDLAKCVDTAVHLVSLDDERAAFAPMMFEGKERAESRLEQIWMPGVHSDVGGVYVEDQLGRVSLLTMADRIATYTDLAMDKASLARLTARSQWLAKINDEMGRFWRMVPFGRVSRSPSLTAPDQFLHPVVDELINGPKIIYKRDGKRSYAPDHRFCDLPRFSGLRPETKFTDLLGL
ncbi:hypothetical protein WSK_4326 [Novosphingobium sp. Rr 2-17]|uniref:T6SS phospholipase effector Tle1-like catalytic domain-containing protein n=1 Tax=Novosphingobium sp. Rr 2-17 TaxID=555793 RepID=UPI0002697F21|nr:DUF2235 domain-containing protein [Novosphingobium sp. Rr 2-17]EIZ77120.1 hypothetical protein WSK_4326 [Novosphingobium sp. Rr 2-17]